MPSFKLFSRRGKPSNNQNTESSSDYHQFSTSNDQPENDQQQAQHVVRGALHTQNIGSKLYAPQNSGGEQEIVSISTGRGDVSTENDIESSWLSNEGSSDDKETSVTDPIAPMNTSTAGSSAAEYIKKEKLLRKKAFNSGTLGGSIRFDYTVSDESSTNADLPYLHVHPDAGWGTELRNKQQGQQEGSIEWTPRDSSYGAAVSACGWVPKRIRRLIEAVFVILTFAILVFIVIKIGQEISSHAHSSGSVGDLDLDDDDHYIAHNNDNNGNGRFRYII